MYKKALTSADFLQLDKAEDILSDVPTAHFALGHNRAATVGGGGDTKAHPFQYGHITMVHNGTLRTRAGLSEYHAVDSASIAMQLEKTEPDKYADLLSKLNGAFTLVWHNQFNNKVYMARNEERPLILGTGYNGETLFFASEMWMITQLGHRINDKMIDVDEAGKKYKVWELPVNELQEYDLDAMSVECTKKTPFTDYVAPINSHLPVVHGGNNHNGGWTPAVVPPIPPYLLGDKLYAKDFDYKENGTSKGIISGVSCDFPNVTFSVGNIKPALATDLMREWAEWEDWLVVDRGKGGDNTFDKHTIYLSGRVSTMHRVGATNQWVANLRLEGLTVDCIEDVEEIDPEKNDMDLPVLGWLEGDDFTIGGKCCTKDEWFKATASGCISCKKVLLKTDNPTLTWDYDMDGNLLPVCETCSDSYFNSF